MRPGAILSRPKIISSMPQARAQIRWRLIVYADHEAKAA